jgi:hypothetical protein
LLDNERNSRPQTLEAHAPRLVELNIALCQECLMPESPDDLTDGLCKDLKLRTSRLEPSYSLARLGSRKKILARATMSQAMKIIARAKVSQAKPRKFWLESS